MTDIDNILNMLDWHMPQETQLQGRFLANKLETFVPFIQPLTPKHNKNVWENCAIIISQKTDEELFPYLIKLFEWIQDLNWPGAYLIYDRLFSIQNDKLFFSFEYALRKSKETQDKVWEEVLIEFGNKKKLIFKGDNQGTVRNH